MATVLNNEEQLKDAFKAAIVEVLQERKDLIRDIIEEVIEDSAFAQAIDEGMASPKVSREQIFDLLEPAT